VFLRWFEDALGILASHGIGFALWELRGPFGILDSGRRDVAYEDWRGHALDRELLELLQRY
jgi:endoglucanase